jgi:hypothetical protein
MNQLCNDKVALGFFHNLSAEQKQLMEQMTLRHDQIELKTNIMDYKKFSGVDTVKEFV